MKNNFKNDYAFCRTEASPISALSGIAIVLLSSFAYQMMFWKIGYFPADEGLMVAVSERMLRGDALYRDIFLPFTPLAWHVEAGAFQIFGTSLATARLLPAILFSSMCGIIYLWSREIMSPVLAAWCAAVFVLYRIWAWPYWQFFTYTVLAIFFAVASGYAFVLFLKRRHPHLSIILSGILAGLCFWAKPNVGVQILAAIFLTLVIRYVARNVGVRNRENRDEMGFVKSCSLVFLGFLAASAPLVLSLVADGAFDDMVAHMSTLRRLYFESQRHIPYPSPWPLFRIDPTLRGNIFYMIPGTGDMCLRYIQSSLFPGLYATPWIEALVKLLYYFPIALLLLSLAVSVQLLKTFRGAIHTAVFTFTFLSSLFLFLQVFFFPAAIYLMVVFPPLIILAFAAYERIIGAEALFERRRLRLIIRICATSALGFFFLISIFGSGIQLLSDKVAVNTPRGTLMAEGARTEILGIIVDYVTATTEPGDTIFVVPHNPLIYFFTDRRNPTRYDNLQPDTPGRQAEEEIIASLERDRTETVIFEKEEFPKKVRFPKAYPDIYKYITENYYPVIDIKGKLKIYKRKTELPRRRKDQDS